MKIAQHFEFQSDGMGGTDKICTACDKGPCIIGHYTEQETPDTGNIVLDQYCVNLPEACILEEYKSEGTAG